MQRAQTRYKAGGVQKQRTGGLKMGRRSNGPEGVLKPNSVERMEEPCTSPFPGREFGLSTTSSTFDIAIADELLSMCRRAVQLCRSFFSRQFSSQKHEAAVHVSAYDV